MLHFIKITFSRKSALFRPEAGTATPMSLALELHFRKIHCTLSQGGYGPERRPRGDRPVAPRLQIAGLRMSLWVGESNFSPSDSL